MSYPPSSGPPDPYGQQPPSKDSDPYAQQGYGGGYPDPYAQQPYPQYGAPATGTNIMAILSLIFAFVFAPVGIVLGHIAKKQIKETHEEGDGLATAGLVISYIFTGLGLLACCAWLVVIIGLGASSST